MSEFLGKPKRTDEDLYSRMRIYKKLPKLRKFFVNNDKPRIHVIVDYDLFEDLEKAVLKKYGNVTNDNINNAAIEALKLWIKENK
ncbi:MAG: hypothetical protein HWN65_11455 [Candidatus Helarchaeota archaeon]|nr:hypothetical protein [Candidatus Helarchaeota archaeon]